MKSASSASKSLQEEEEEEEDEDEEDFPLSNNLKDLQNLRLQLYAAAEYFELSYADDSQKQIMIETLKDYAIKAVVNTVDHLGSVAYKVNGFVDENIVEASATELQVNCIEQRLKTCQTHSELQGLRQQQSLVLNLPRYHKRYAKCGHEWLVPWKAIPSCLERTESPRGSYSKEGDLQKKPGKKRTISPCRFPLPRASFLPSRENVPNPSQPANRRTQKVWRSGSGHGDHGDDHGKEREQHPSKSKGLIGALFNKRKPRKDDEVLYAYLDKFS